MKAKQYTQEQIIHLNETAAVVRTLTLDAIEKAQSGHPGLPLGCAELGALIFSEFLQHNPNHIDWTNRDKFVLSGGHGSMMLYALLHVSGYDLSIEDIKNFRVLKSKTPGHPEYGATPGVETTTGPLGQGVSTAVGMAIAQKQQASIYNETSEIFNNCTIVLAGDGDMMEGVACEAASLAGTLELDNLIVFYDSNNKTIDGDTELAFTENVEARFKAYGWDVYECDGYDYDDMTEAFRKARFNGKRPSLISVKTLIGKGAPNFEDTSKAHSGAMGNDEINHIRRNAGFPVDKSFFVPQSVYDFFAHKQEEWDKNYTAWIQKYSVIENEIFNRKMNLADDQMMSIIREVAAGDQIESRSTFSKYLGIVQTNNSAFLGGSADVTSPCLNKIGRQHTFNAKDRTGNFLYFGVREHAMAAISNGIALQSGYRSYCSTFLSFVDYLRPALRLSALMRLPVLYVLAYDSVFNGEDGPTHQPVEQLPSLRCMPNLIVMRPGDAQESVVCARMALKEKIRPSVCITTRQKLTCYTKEDENWISSMEKHGAYVVKKAAGKAVYTIVATGSEVSTVTEAVKTLLRKDDITIVSMPCREYFLETEKKIQDTIIDPSSRVIVVEAAEEQGWSKISDKKVEFIGISEFGGSAPAEVISAARGIDTEGVVNSLKSII